MDKRHIEVGRHQRKGASVFVRGFIGVKILSVYLNPVLASDCLNFWPHCFQTSFKILSRHVPDLRKRIYFQPFQHRICRGNRKFVTAKLLEGLGKIKVAGLESFPFFIRPYMIPIKSQGRLEFRKTALF